MIECKNLTKKYSGKTALDGVTLTISKGVYGIIGENGAGKSTLFRILMGQAKASSGQVLIDGQPPEDGRLRIGYLPQKFDFFHHVTVYDTLEYLGTLKGMDESELDNKIKILLDQVNLLGEKDKKVSALSGGMRQRLGIAQAFLGEPDYILLDEPTVGLDPKERLAFRNLVNEIGMRKTVLISTHIIEDVQSTCENTLVLQKGRLLYSGTTSDFIGRSDTRIFSVRIPRQKLSELNKHLSIISVTLFGDQLEVRFAENNPDQYQLPYETKEEKCTLEDAYFLATGMLNNLSKNFG